MGPIIQGDSTLPGYSAAVENDLRILRQIESRARDLQSQIDRLESRWNKKADSLASRTGGRLAYDFGDCLA